MPEPDSGRGAETLPGVRTEETGTTGGLVVLPPGAMCRPLPCPMLVTGAWLLPFPLEAGSMWEAAGEGGPLPRTGTGIPGTASPVGGSPPALVCDVGMLLPVPCTPPLLEPPFSSGGPEGVPLPGPLPMVPLVPGPPVGGTEVPPQTVLSSPASPALIPLMSEQPQPPLPPRSVAGMLAVTTVVTVAAVLLA